MFSRFPISITVLCYIFMASGKEVINSWTSVENFSNLWFQTLTVLVMFLKLAVYQHLISYLISYRIKDYVLLGLIFLKNIITMFHNLKSKIVFKAQSNNVMNKYRYNCYPCFVYLRKICQDQVDFNSNRENSDKIFQLFFRIDFFFGHNK